MNERRIPPRSRHAWTEDERGRTSCTHCGMTRHRVQTRKRCGCYGLRDVVSTIYRYANGRQAWKPGQGNKVPPCEPCCASCGRARYHAADCPQLAP